MLLASAPDATPAHGSEAPSENQLAGTQWAQVTIEQRVIVRIPTMRPRQQPSSAMTEAAPVPPPPPVRWKETKGPKCLPLGGIRGAVLTAQNGVTMVTTRQEQYRAHFSRSCRAADFYAGFYIQPNDDGALCAGRDTLHARNGSTCEIEKFSRMIPDPAPPEKPEKPRKAERSEH